MAIFTSAIGGRYAISQKMNWQTDSSISIAFIGASHITRGIDLTNIKHAANFSKPSERYMFTYLKLERLLAANESVDTIVLQCAPTDLWQHTDDKYFAENEMSEFIPLFYPLFGKQEWKAFSGHYVSLLKYIAQHAFDQSLFCENQYLERVGIKQEPELLIEKMDVKSVHKDLAKGECGNNINIEYLNKIITICERYHKKIYLLYCPVYKPEYFYNQKEYYLKISEIRENKHITYLYYSHFYLPDSCFYDAHHLNAEGAKLFTEELFLAIRRQNTKYHSTDVQNKK